MFNVNILFAVLIDDGRVIDDLYFCIRNKQERMNKC